MLILAYGVRWNSLNVRVLYMKMVGYLQGFTVEVTQNPKYMKEVMRHSNDKGNLTNWLIFNI